MTNPNQPGQVPQWGPPPPAPQKSHTLRTVLIVLAIVIGVPLLLFAGCAALVAESGIDSGAVPVTSETPAAEEPAGEAEPPGPTVAKIGQWVEAEDGVEFRVSKLRRSAVSEIAAGGRPGNPAVAVTVQIRNGSTQRLDLSLISVSARLGEDGRESEQVFQEGYEGAPMGSLAPGRTSTSKYLFDAKNERELKTISVDLAPGMEYQSFTFEGGLG